MGLPDKSMDSKVVALAGNPNVGKSTVFNGLTGLKQHTGNWPGKTVVNAQGYCTSQKYSYVMVDLPGTYSLMAHSAEEEVARNFICFGEPDAVVVVCDATCLERNLNLVLQILEITGRVIVCVNLMDEAKRKGIQIDLAMLSERLNVPVIGTDARKKEYQKQLLKMLDKLLEENAYPSPKKIVYPEGIELAVEQLSQVLREKYCDRINVRWLSLKLLEQEKTLLSEMENYLTEDILCDESVQKTLAQAQEIMRHHKIMSQEQLKDKMVSALVQQAEEICQDTVSYEKEKYAQTDRKIDSILTSRRTGYPIMLILLAIVLWITIIGANYFSELLSTLLFGVENYLTDFFTYLQAPQWLHEMLVFGIYRVLAWVVSVMLPPMAIFFPLFTLLEDAGYLPRVAYNLDKTFQKCCACGKQALCMCMGFGCNAAGVIGCRIIDSPRERFLAILTNNFVPCNGRFPMLIAVATLFFIRDGKTMSSFGAALVLTAMILMGVMITFAVTKILSRTLLKGVPSSFTLELPPYRKPQIGKVILHSIFDRTLFVLGRAIAVAAPAGLLIWGMANITVGNHTLLNHCAEFLNPFARLLGMDGIILMAFILGFPANEIIIPIITMGYMAQGSILELGSGMEMKNLFVENGWTWKTAVSVLLFSMNHWPCSTTLLTIKKETGSCKWMAAAAAIPTGVGIGLCMLFHAITCFFP